jgi:hypothetical protein
MKYAAVLMVLLAGLCGSIGPAAAADLGPMTAQSWRMTAPRDTLPFPRSERSQAVWASNTCWSQCGSSCTWGEVECLEHDSQGQCLKLTDKCDRSCQRTCRGASAGPFLPLEFPWD